MGMALFNGGLRWGGGAKFGTSTTPCCCEAPECNQCTSYTSTSQNSTSLPTTGTRGQFTEITHNASNTTIAATLNALIPEWKAMLAGWDPPDSAASTDFLRSRNDASVTVAGVTYDFLSVRLLCTTSIWFTGRKWIVQLEAKETSTNKTAYIRMEPANTLDDIDTTGSCCDITVSTPKADAGTTGTGNEGPIESSFTFTVSAGTC